MQWIKPTVKLAIIWLGNIWFVLHEKIGSFFRLSQHQFGGPITRFVCQNLCWILWVSGGKGFWSSTISTRSCVYHVPPRSLKVKLISLWTARCLLYRIRIYCAERLKRIPFKIKIAFLGFLFGLKGVPVLGRNGHWVTLGVTGKEYWVLFVLESRRHWVLVI